MSQLNDLLNQRLKKGTNASKMSVLAKQSVDGNLSSFSGVFSVAELTDREKESLKDMLSQYANGEEDLTTDLRTLISITSEVKAINNQAALLHGERIRKAQIVLTKYRDGAFSAWLMSTYGNRQTPYNFLQYFEFYETMPIKLRPQIEAMPRQTIYTLASREGSLDTKQKIIEGYQGQTKQELLQQIRLAFPLAKNDRRRGDPGETILGNLTRLYNQLREAKAELSAKQKREVQSLLDLMKKLL